MPRVSQHPKSDSVNFRIDPALKAAFTLAAEAEDRPAAQVLRDFMRAYVERRNRKAFEAEARRQSRAAAERARDPGSDEAQSLRELETLLDADDFADDWKA
ncbi:MULTISPECIES: hypothetical protein [unclassified Chelatococcus]|uniref:hypothetical protein n=1 Tax=unclassified Chelatococcus TaxID=2638111 RepID=UPI001BCA8A35|nr:MULTISPECIES: hypothetical protein [unclassified Chelatococcus]MBS7701592.1 hypothetical protein [Chelatococcus sp. YT9]MBX3559707.1 hypothetical protein [Chelatococcus sp.]